MDNTGDDGFDRGYDRKCMSEDFAIREEFGRELLGGYSSAHPAGGRGDASRPAQTHAQFVPCRLSICFLGISMACGTNQGHEV